MAQTHIHLVWQKSYIKDGNHAYGAVPILNLTYHNTTVIPKNSMVGNPQALCGQFSSTSIT